MARTFFFSGCCRSEFFRRKKSVTFDEFRWNAKKFGFGDIFPDNFISCHQDLLSSVRVIFLSLSHSQMTSIEGNSEGAGTELAIQNGNRQILRNDNPSNVIQGIIIEALL